MAKKYQYKIFPETTKARVLLGLAFAGGLIVMAAYFAVVFVWPYAEWWDEIEVTYVNRTDETIAIYVDNDLDVTVRPGEEVRVDYREIQWWWDADVEVRDLQGRLIGAFQYDNDDLEDLDHRIVIED